MSSIHYIGPEPGDSECFLRQCASSKIYVTRFKRLYPKMFQNTLEYLISLLDG